MKVVTNKNDYYTHTHLHIKKFIIIIYRRFRFHMAQNISTILKEYSKYLIARKNSG